MTNEPRDEIRGRNTWRNARKRRKRNRRDASPITDFLSGYKIHLTSRESGSSPLTGGRSTRRRLLPLSSRMHEDFRSFRNFSSTVSKIGRRQQSPVVESPIPRVDSLLRDTVLVIPYSSETETNIYRRGCEKGIPVTPVRLGIRINGRWYFIGSFSKLSQPVRGDNDLWRRNKWRRPLFLRESYKSERRSTRQVLWAFDRYTPRYLGRGISANEASRGGGWRWYWLRKEIWKSRTKWARIVRQRFHDLFFRGRESLAFFLSPPPPPSLLDKYISLQIYSSWCVRDIASSTRPISSDGKNNGVGSSSGLYLTFLRSYMTLFLLIMRAAQHVSSFIYHFQYSISTLVTLRACSAFSRPFSLFHNFFFFFFPPRSFLANSFPPIISHQRPSRLSSTRTDEPMIRISSRNFRRSKIYRFEIHPEKARFHQRNELTNCIWTRAFERHENGRENVCKQGKERFGALCGSRSIRGFIPFRIVYPPVSLRAKYPRDISYSCVEEYNHRAHAVSHRILKIWLSLSCAIVYEFFFSFFFFSPSFFSSFSSLLSPTSIYFVWTFRVSNKFARI